ncbi:MAG: GSU2086 family protein [Planctomycetota bacterium]
MKKQKKVHKPIKLDRIKTYPIKQRKNLVSIDRFGKAIECKDFNKFIDSLPNFLAANDLRNLIDSIVNSYKKERQVVLALGAHVIKCGLSPIVIDMMKRGIVTAVAMNGSGAIHDYEISLIGETSEDVSHSLKDGSFGMARETADAIQSAASMSGSGLGRALGNKILEDKNKYKQHSILAAGARLNIPVTVHVAIGTDTIHMHPNVSGSDIGESSHIDFKILCSVVSRLEGGVWLNIGSAVIMPEVFLKAITVARNLGKNIKNFTTANMDMIQHYRPQTNIVSRPTKRGYSITGHHEIMLPLLRLGVLSKL